jgi:hypothetical protein
MKEPDECPAGLKPTLTEPLPVLSDSNLVFAMRLSAKVPSLNALFAANHWGRKRIKAAIQRSFGSALSQSGGSFWIQTTFAEKRQSIASDMQALFETTLRQMSESKRSKGKPRRAKKSTR